MLGVIPKQSLMSELRIITHLIVSNTQTHGTGSFH